MAELVLLIGLQASGKTTFYRSRFADTHVHVSKDRLRNSGNPERRQRALVREALASGRDVVVDNTNASPEQRAPLIAIGRELGARIVGYFLETSVADSIRRNSQRPGKERIPEVGIYVTSKRLKPPAREEGFDELFRVRLVEQSKDFRVEPVTG
jgi:predicted kinase